MIKMFQQILFSTIFLGGFLICQNACAACTGGGTSCTKSGTTWTCTDASYGCIQDAVNAATAGDTINITATGTVSWPSNAVIVPSNKQPLKLIGPGSSKLTITLNSGYAIVVQPYAGSIASPGTRISGFKLYSPLNKHAGGISIGGSAWRIDHNEFESINTTALVGSIFIAATPGSNNHIQLSGLVDHNVFKNGMAVSGGMAAWDDQNLPWSIDPGLGTEAAMYIEDNIFSSANGLEQQMSDTNRGGKLVIRYNTTSDCSINTHSLQAADERGTRKWEIYGNTFRVTGDRYAAITLQAGTGVVFGNDFTPDTGYAWSRPILLQNVRSGQVVGLSGQCNGSSTWDGNLDATGWPCRDQVGAGIDAFLWGDPPESHPVPAQSRLPAYMWSNITGLSLIVAPTVNVATDHIKSNRDYYIHNPSFNGTGGTIGGSGGGVGCGTFANLPRTCTAGVAYWATNQSCTNMTGLVGRNPATPISGTLYKCTSTNHWDAYYTPYAYPHPLQGTADTTPPAAPDGLTVN